MKRLTIVSLGVLALLVFFDALNTAAVKKNIQVALDRNRIKDMTSSGLLLDFIVKISNSSSSRYFLTKYDYRAVVSQTEYLRLAAVLDAPIAVEPKSEALVALPLKITYALLFETIPGLEQNSRIGCALTGMMVFAVERKREEKIPFAFQGEFPVFKDPEVRIADVRVKDVTLGGADIILGFSLVNKNDFDLEAGLFRYKLELGGRSILEGSAQGPLVLAAGVEKVFSYPTLLDFFEMGSHFFPTLQQPEVDGLLTGDIEAETIWGSVKIPIAKAQKIQIAKSGAS